MTILRSLHSGIVGVSDSRCEQPTGKFAVYLSNNNFDIDVVVSMVLLLYRLDAMSRKNDENVGIWVSHETLTYVKEFMNDHMTKLQTVKSHLKESINILNNIQLDTIEKVLLHEKLACDKKETSSQHSCVWCGKEFYSGSALGGHKRSCKSRP